MHRAPEQPLFTPRDAALYPIRIEAIEVASAGLIASGDLLLVMRVADGRRMAMRAPMAGRVLRIMASVGDVIPARACAMTMRTEPDLVLEPHTGPHTRMQGAAMAEAPWGEDEMWGADWPRGTDDLPPFGGAALGRIKPVKRAATPEELRAMQRAQTAPPPHAANPHAATSRTARPQAKRPSKLVPWLHRNSGEHDVEAPHSKQLWAGLAGLVVVLFLLGAIPRDLFKSDAPGPAAPQSRPDPAPQTPQN